MTRPGYRGPISTTDIIIEYNDGTKEGIVFIERANPPRGLALPGGFAEEGLTLPQNARKEAWEETGLEVVLENELRPFTYSEPQRDPRGHMISHMYYGRGSGTLQAGDDAKKAMLLSIEEAKQLRGKGILVFDHEKILEDYLRHRGYIA